jgi:HSP20 family molecular chaperone IbpA
MINESYPGIYKPDRHFSELINQTFAGSPMTKSEPVVIVKESAMMKEIWMELPGVLKQDIEIRLCDRILIVRACFIAEDIKRNHESRIRIPTHADAWFIHAVFELGILKIKIPIDKKAAYHLTKEIIIY